MHLLRAPFRTRAAALKESKLRLPDVRLAVCGRTEADRVLEIEGGFAALARPDERTPRFDVYHGAKGAATRRQLVDDEEDYD